MDEDDITVPFLQQESINNASVSSGSDEPHSGSCASPDPTNSIHVYKSRWYILFTFSLLSLAQAAIWNTWGPLAQSGHDIFGWQNKDIALLTNWGPISYIVADIPFSWMMDVKGCRLACVITAFFCFVGTALRCITLKKPYSTWLINIGQAINGAAGPVVMAAPPVLSSIWFPLHQRFTATAITSLAAVFGSTISPLIGPLIVQTNTTNISTSVIKPQVIVSIEEEKSEMNTLLRLEFIFCAVVFIMVLVYFPDKPPSPPSASAAAPRLEFKSGFFRLIKNQRFWLVCLVYGVVSGITNGWLSVLYINLKPLKISQYDAGMMIFYGGCFGCLGAFAVARLTDVLAHHMRKFILVLNSLSVFSLIWFQLIFMEFLHVDLVSVYASVVISLTLLMSGIPLLFELSCEVAFPVAEGITNGILTMASNIATLLFLGILMIPNISTSWMNWVMLVSDCITIPALLTLKDDFSRLQLDNVET